MRIGLFSDVYLPAVNGISYVLQITHDQLTRMGHEVYIFAPATTLTGREPNDPPYVYRFPAVEGVFFDEQFTSVFFPPVHHQRIKRLNLDIIHYFTPGQIGLLGIYVATKEDIPLISQYSTDLYQYVEKYPSVLPGTVALSLATPFALRMTPRELMRLLAVFKPHRTLTKWHKSTIKRIHIMLHNRSDAVIALSSKMKKQLDGWGSTTPTTLLPTGIDPILPPSDAAAEQFRADFGIAREDKVLMYAGRLSKEKNLEVLLQAFQYVADSEPRAKLLLVGGFSYREQLEQIARSSRHAARIVFTGRMDRQDLGMAYAVADVFVFPSLTDTQGLVVNEAAAAGVPLVLCDAEVSEVFNNGGTGLLAPNTALGFADTVLRLLADEKLRQKLGRNAKRQAAKFTEHGQAKKLEKLYARCIKQHAAKRDRLLQ